MTELVNFVNPEGRVSSKLVAEKFGKQHKDVLRSIKNLESELSNDFKRRNFAPLNIIRENAVGKKAADPEYLMTRDGFSILAMGFTGKAALAWKEKFLGAFNKMEKAMLSELPQLRATVARLQSERLQLAGPQKNHPLSNTVLVPILEDTIFGTSEIRYVRVKKNDDRYSDQSFVEGEIKRLSNLVEGMSKKIARLNDHQAKTRRK